MGMPAFDGPERPLRANSYPEDPQPPGYRPQMGITAYWLEVCVQKKNVAYVKKLAKTLARPLGNILNRLTSSEYEAYLREGGWSQEDIESTLPKAPRGTALFWVEVPVREIATVRRLLKPNVRWVRIYNFSRVEDVPGPYVPAEDM